MRNKINNIANIALASQMIFFVCYVILDKGWQDEKITFKNYAGFIYFNDTDLYNN